MKGGGGCVEVNKVHYGLCENGKCEVGKNREGLYLLYQDKLMPQKHRKIIIKKIASQKCSEAKNAGEVHHASGHWLSSLSGF